MPGMINKAIVQFLFRNGIDYILKPFSEKIISDALAEYRVFLKCKFGCKKK
jgi:response regulator of citrate/malate metabolism